MEARKPATIGLTILAYVVATFGVQGASHFAINAGHYAAIPIMRAEPVVAMGIVVEGSVAFVQFTLFGVLLGLIHRGRSEG